jgi:hypothetical protein
MVYLSCWYHIMYRDVLWKPLKNPLASWLKGTQVTCVTSHSSNSWHSWQASSLYTLRMKLTHITPDAGNYFCSLHTSLSPPQFIFDFGSFVLVLVFLKTAVFCVRHPRDFWGGLAPISCSFCITSTQCFWFLFSNGPVCLNLLPIAWIIFLC